MPSKPVHILTSAGAGLAVTTIIPVCEQIIDSVPYKIGGFIGGSIGGMMPDIIDPPRHPNHRALGHSVTANTIVLGTLATTLPVIEMHLADLIEEAIENDNDILAGLYQFLIGIVRGFIAGQVMHLILDLTTPKRLPF